METKSQVKEIMQHMVVTSAETGEQREVFLYRHSNKYVDWVWHKLYGNEGQRLPERKRKRFRPQ